MAPVRASTKFAVRNHLQARILLPLNHLRYSFVLDLSEGNVINLSCIMLAEGGRQFFRA